MDSTCQQRAAGPTRSLPFLSAIVVTKKHDDPEADNTIALCSTNRLTLSQKHPLNFHAGERTVALMPAFVVAHEPKIEHMLVREDSTGRGIEVLPGIPTPISTVYMQTPTKLHITSGPFQSRENEHGTNQLSSMRRAPQLWPTLTSVRAVQKP